VTDTSARRREALARRERALRKKLRQIDDLIARRAAGDALSEEQTAKADAREACAAELAAVLAAAAALPAGAAAAATRDDAA
jgi:uncharacterized protein with WD repeat